MKNCQLMRTYTRSKTWKLDKKQKPINVLYWFFLVFFIQFSSFILCMFWNWTFQLKSPISFVVHTWCMFCWFFHLEGPHQLYFIGFCVLLLVFVLFYPIFNFTFGTFWNPTFWILQLKNPISRVLRNDCENVLYSKFCLHVLLILHLVLFKIR